MDTWSRGTKQSQTKPILPDLPLPAKRKTSLNSFVTRPYASTPQSQKQSQTNPISPPQATLYSNSHLVAIGRVIYDLAVLENSPKQTVKDKTNANPGRIRAGNQNQIP